MLASRRLFRVCTKVWFHVDLSLYRGHTLAPLVPLVLQTQALSARGSPSAHPSLSLRSGFMLTSLCIDSPITPSECLSLLRLFPDLRELEIREPSSDPEFEGLDFPWKIITDGFLNGLRTSYSTDSLFKNRTTIPCIPRLLHLSLHVTKPTFEPETLDEMVRSRWIPDPAFSSEIGIDCLRSIKLIGDERATEEPLVYKSLMELENFGLRVEIF
ncbi:hypothetical protein K435DRAFT_868364 [Dendrothele bispora CBS 962.96]|uniref:F-box domain-containing protein n=1 Tax=Dendrothele bispora (strain CBS 962.96) TaxID=1314807 RepID=A0A4S8LBW4_DENBC|nr:hypothetical protein K435DRAFT_868364 [Dendrothele bispora CBS 962.96]